MMVAHRRRAGEIAGAVFAQGGGMGQFRIGLFDAVGILTDEDLLVAERVRIVRP